MLANLLEFSPITFIIIDCCCAGQKHAYNLMYLVVIKYTVILTPVLFFSLNQRC